LTILFTNVTQEAVKLSESFPQGYALLKFPLDAAIAGWVKNEQWKEVETAFIKLTRPGAPLFQILKPFHDFSGIEIMISIRNAQNDWEEDGIWHDDGSRVFAFSLSLTFDADQIEGGCLELRRKDSETSVMIPTPEYGTAILFLTGVHGFEHRTRQVLKGKRVILVGWCS
jgi:hypothetical protein